MLNIRHYSRRNPIATRLMVLILLISTLLAAAVVCLQVYLAYEDDMAELESRLDQVRISTLPSITKSLWSFDEEQLQVQIRSVLEVEDVVQVTVLWRDWNDDEQAMMASSLDKDLDLDEVDRITRQVVVKQYPLVYRAEGVPDQALGTLVVTVSLASVYEKLYQRAWITGGVQMTQALLVSVLILWLVRYLLTRHIEAIATYTRRLNLENLNIGLRLTRLKKPESAPDELDNVVSAINQMRLSLVEDIEARRLMEEALRAEKEETLVSRREAAVAEEANRAKSQFLATMSHEIRTPMNGVIGMVELLRDTPLNDNQQHYLEVIHRSGETLLTIINDILDYSKIEAGKMELESVAFSPEALVDDCVELFGATANKRRIELIGSVSPDLPARLYGDPTRLRQILINLLGNAFKFTEQGSVTVRMEPCGDADSEALPVRFTVTDTGVGISAETQKHLFQSFTQADSSTTRKYGGTGLGLAICKRLVELMGGEIGVHSEPGRGSSFWFTASFGPVTAAGLTDAGDSPPLLAGRSMLVVEDSPLLQETLQLHGQTWGMEVVTATGRRSCLSALVERRASGKADFDFISLDYYLPGDDGIRVAQEIRQQYPHCSSQLFMLTAADDTFEPELLQACGIVRVLRKPLSPAKLRTELCSMLGHISGSPALAGEGRPQIDLSTLKVLVAEDNAVNRLVIKGLLGKLGIEPVMVENGRQVLAACDAAGRRFDAILMDCEMPEMDGFEATRRLRRLEQEQGAGALPIVALTAHAMSEHREQVFSCGMDYFLCKPLTLAELRTTLEKIVARRPGHRALQGAVSDS
ncbi:response regulator [Pseudomaricurvus sp. HS19]|uniref:hybrid sensor histidine kinase/response regulator n=1 Tax=Pseudomaricurvus sp. HS19 TaxID=2692626 RepID=UPI001369EA22|nr:response regulator [Pseudomaricurvus sp. HS19]MYM63519.1 response regulator [Pseudomaricurvus sp. HS19]